MQESGQSNGQNDPGMLLTNSVLNHSYATFIYNTQI